MLPKKEKISKQKVKLEEDRVTKKIDDPTRLRRNRIFVVITLSLTICLSLSLFIYRKINVAISTGQSVIPRFQITFPTINHALPGTTNTLDSSVNNIIIHTPGVWSVYGRLEMPGRDNFVWSRNMDNMTITTQEATLEPIPASTNATIAPYLPEGLLISESVNSENGISAAYLIKLPDRRIFISINNPDKSPSLVPLVPALVSNIYWELVSR